MSQSQHIIIVDDEAPAREMVGDYLKMHGFTVTLCDGGKSLRGAIETGSLGHWIAAFEAEQQCGDIPPHDGA